MNHSTLFTQARRKVFGLISRGWLLAMVAMVLSAPLRSQPLSRNPSYPELVALFGEWRAFQKPKLVNGVPDYSVAAMADQQKGLTAFQARLKAFDLKAWSVPQQVDYQIVRAEMSGLEFDHRVLRPWANTPLFYQTVFWEQSDQPAREGPLAFGAVELWSYSFPLSKADAAAIDTGIRAIPGLLAQAKTNLVGNQRDLWSYGTRYMKGQSADLAKLAAKLSETGASPNAELLAHVRQAIAATDTFLLWLEAQTPTKTVPSGIGVANYNWYLKHVQLLPHTWQDEVTLMNVELARAQALLLMEEQRNAELPQQVPIANAEEFNRRVPPAVTQYMAFLKDQNIMTLQPYLEPALRAQVGAYSPGPREFFTEVNYRDPEVLRTHGYHWFDLARQANDPPSSPIRKRPLLYNIFNTRTEGNATGWEELMLQAGMFNDRPRSRELIYILLAERAARALASLRMQSNEFTLEQAAAFACANTPRGWLGMQGELVRAEQYLYLEQPGYGTCYITGKLQLQQLLVARKQQLGNTFTLKTFMDEFNSAGMIPASLLRWELTGQLPEGVRKMLVEP